MFVSAKPDRTVHVAYHRLGHFDSIRDALEVLTARAYDERNAAAIFAAEDKKTRKHLKRELAALNRVAARRSSL